MGDWHYTPAGDHELTLDESFRSLHRESGLLAKAGHLVWWTLISLYMRGIHRITVKGRNNLPLKGPFVMVANHTSDFDVAVLAAALPFRLRIKLIPMAAGDTFFSTKRKSAFSALALNALPVWRKSGGIHVMRKMRERLNESDTIIILFPEGTRSRDGNMASFKMGIGMVVAGTSVAVVPCKLTGCFEAFPPGAKLPKLGSISLSIGEPVTFAHVPIAREGYGSIASSLEERIRNLM